jgi:hypothetical protein
MTAKRTLGGGPSALGAVASLCVPDRIPLVGSAVGVAVWALRLAGDAAVGGLEDSALAPADADAADAPGGGGGAFTTSTRQTLNSPSFSSFSSFSSSSARLC